MHRKTSYIFLYCCKRKMYHISFQTKSLCILPFYMYIHMHRRILVTTIIELFCVLKGSAVIFSSK